MRPADRKPKARSEPQASGGGPDQPEAGRAAEVAAAFARAREAAHRIRRRTLGERTGSLGMVLDDLRDPRSPVRRALETELPEATGFSPPVVREGLARALEPWSGEALHALVEAELVRFQADGRVATGFPSTAVVLGGALPSPSVLACLTPLVLGSAVVAKPSASDPVTASAVARALRARDPQLGACLEVVPFPSGDATAVRALLEADCVVASGSDATVAALGRAVVPPRRLVAYGHRISFAALGPSAQRGRALGHAAERLALDVALWDQLGCLSPAALFVAGGDRVPDRVLDALAAALDQAEARWPRGRTGPAAAAAAAQARGEAEVRAAAGAAVRVRTGTPDRWTVVAEADARLRPTPLHRFLRVHPVADEAALVGALRPVAGHLSAVGLAGFGRGSAGLARVLAGLGASRVCPFGAMQAPPLAWCRDGQGVLLPLARWSDLDL